MMQAWYVYDLVTRSLVVMMTHPISLGLAEHCFSKAYWGFKSYMLPDVFDAAKLSTLVKMYPMWHLPSRA